MSLAARDRPIYVCGVARSGTSLMRAILGMNSAVAMPPEELHWWTRLLPRYRQATGGRDWQLFLDRFADWPQTRLLGLDRDELRARLESLQPGDHGQVFGTTMRAFAERLGKPRWGDKAPQLELFVSQIGEAFPGAAFVYMVRDPRDVAISMYHYRPRFPRRRIARDVTWVTLNWRESVRVARGVAARDPGRFFLVRYETLVDRPRETIAELCGQLGLEFELPMLEPHRFAGFGARGNSSFGEHDGIDRAGLARHLGRLPARQVRLCEWLLGDELAAMGYAPERPPLGAREAALLPLEVAGAAADASVRALDRLVRGVPR
ncbi:MAG TPA: sulfotransferase [Candidatus Limnocylindrales bacterium]|jgi:hypothetical protein|nr:sulfotransferase [Candidatus Limnocylindrales bacterium]